jgi:hypothetical protein
LREFGVTLKELDLLDEEKMTGDQVLAVLAVMLVICRIMYLYFCTFVSAM